ncbi:MAG TPA: tetratricopeptide repeat protein [Terracidiphilus sp.]
MKFGFVAALAVTMSMACPAIRAQSAAGGGSSSNQDKSQQNQPATSTPSAPESQSKGNPFPGSTSNVPILPSGPTENAPESSGLPENNVAAFPPDDQDPVRSPDQVRSDSGETQGFSSSQAGVDDIVPPPNEPSGKGKNDQGITAMPQESPENDINVGDYYLSQKNWRAALSRFQSALVLEPDNPEVYWGLAESERHTGDYASAREHYLKVLEYDPGSKHAKDAKKALKDPEIANAKAAPAGVAH